MTNKYNDALYRNPNLARFYDIDNEWRADFDVYLARAASAASDIAFPSFAEICDVVEYSGLAVSRVCGDWQHSPFQPGSPEMVFELCHPGHTQTCAA